MLNDTPTWKYLDQERLQLLQAIHDERDASRVKEMLASFVKVKSKEDFSIQLPSAAIMQVAWLVIY